METPSYADLHHREAPASARWAGAGFRAELVDWVTSVLGEVSSLQPLRIRSWATVWRIEGATGVHFAKQNCRSQAFEAALLDELARIAPDRVVPVSAVDRERGLLLTPDQGRPLGRATGADVDLDAWCRVVAAGADLQRRTAPYADRLVAAGLPQMPPGDTVAWVEQRLDDFGSLDPDDARAVEPERLGALRGLLPRVRGWVDELAALGLPDSLNHNDLHGDNVFDTVAGLRFFDFGDALLMHPLSALFVPVNVLVQSLDAGPDDPRVLRVLDAGLEAWSDLVPARELRRALPAALQLGRLGRAESWIRCLPTMTDAELTELGPYAGYWTTSLLLDLPVGPGPDHD